MRGEAAVGLYASLLRFYPRNFREAYGPDMRLLFAHQLRDEAAIRVWGRALLDLALTVPTHHLEHLMTRTSSSTASLPYALGAVSLVSATVAVTVGSVLGVAAVAATVAVLSAALAVVAWRRSRPVIEPVPLADNWWKLLVAGGVALTALMVATTATGELPGTLWWPAMLLGLLSLSTLIGGGFLGLAHFMRPRSGTTS